MSSKTFFCIDAHTCGNPVRLVAGGGPNLKGDNMSEKRQHFLKEYDWIRKGLMFEPRGHDMMSGSILYPPHDPANDVAVLFIETSGCLPMCGHGTIGTITIAIEEGLIIPKTPGIVRMEAPAGLVSIEYKQEGAKVKSVKLTNVPSYLAAENLDVECPDLGTLTFDVSYGGNFYAIVDPQVNFKGLENYSADQLISWSRVMRQRINENYTFVHPENPTINTCTHILWAGKTISPEATARNAVFYGDKAIDRSPCGTGTSARMAQWHAKGKLKKGDVFIHESIIGSQFIGRVEDEVKIGDKPAIIPSIEGWARVYGYNTIKIDDEDPYAYGFQVYLIQKGMNKAIIIGGGVIGLFSAYYLQKSGWEVAIIDQGDLSDNCSYGNAGMITPSHFVPLAAPGMVEQGIRWMFNSKSPFYVKPALDRELFGWGLKFLKSATQKHVNHSARALRDISVMSKKLFWEFEKDSKIDFGLEDKGILMLFKTAKFLEEEKHLVETAANLGLDAQYLSPEDCARLQPGIEMNILGAVHYHCDAHLYPNKLMTGLIKYLEASDKVTIHRNTEIVKIAHDGGKITSVSSVDHEFKGDAYVLAGGAWSPGISKLAGLKVPLMPGKGYSFMVPQDDSKRMSIPSILCEARVAVTPMNGSIRYGGTMEVGRINEQVNMNRVKGIVESVPKYFPNFKPEVPQRKDIWFGFRPVSPDGLPYIGLSGKYKNLAIATGHAMIGLSLGPATGKLIYDVLNGIKPSMNIEVFSPDRFQ